MNTESTLKIYRNQLVIYYKHNNEVLRLSTGIYPNQKEFDDSSKNLIGKKEKHNIDVKKKKLEIDELILRAIDDHSSNRVIYVKSKIAEKENKKIKHEVSNTSKNKKTETIDGANNKQSLIYLYNEFLNEHYLSKNRIKKGTQKVWKTGLTDITKFVNYQHKYKNISDVDEDFINDFQDYLSECTDVIENEKVLKYTGRTITKKTQCIKKFIRTRKKDLTFIFSNDNHKKVQVYSSEVVTFTDVEYDLIKNYQVENLEEQKIKDMTLVMCSTSLNISDLKQINKAFIDSNNVLQLNRTKSHTAQYIPLNKLTIEILERNNYCMISIR